MQFLSVDEAEGVSKFLSDATAQWKNLSLEVRSVRSMLEEVISNWEKHSSTVAALQAWLEDAEQMLNQSENVKHVSTISVPRLDRWRHCNAFLGLSFSLFLGFFPKPPSLGTAAHGHERCWELPH